MDFIRQLKLIDANSIALAEGHRQLTYKQLITQVEQTAAWLSQQDASVVAFHAQNSIQWVITDLACQLAGVACLPLPEFFSKEQIQHCLQSSRADLFIATNSKLLITDATQVLSEEYLHSGLNAWKINHNKVAITTLPSGTGKITFTSGSTGQPKGVCLSNEHQWQVAMSLAEVINIQRPKHLCILPLATLLENIAGVYTPLLCGGEVIIPAPQESGLSGSSDLNLAALTRCISDHQPHSLILIPQLLSALITGCEQGWHPPPSLKFVAVGGAKVDAQLIDQARDYGIPVYEGYGLSECGSVVALNTPQAEKKGSAGRVLPHCDVNIVDGEIHVSGASFLGYLNQPESYYPDNVATGDLGTVDDEFLNISGRSKTLIITSFGRNISPEWIESKLLAKYWLQQCAVVGEAQSHLSALLLAPDTISNQLIDQWLTKVNQELPDYARVLSWLRLPDDQWAHLLTANGRPKRQLIEQKLADDINHLYQQIA